MKYLYVTKTQLNEYTSQLKEPRYFLKEKKNPVFRCHPLTTRFHSKRIDLRNVSRDKWSEKVESPDVVNLSLS